jgi:hypothetical protein
MRRRFGGVVVATAVVLGAVFVFAASPVAADGAGGATVAREPCGRGFPDTIYSDTAHQVVTPGGEIFIAHCVFLDVSSQTEPPDRAQITQWAPTFVFERSRAVLTPAGVEVLWGANGPPRKHGN